MKIILILAASLVIIVGVVNARRVSTQVLSETSEPTASPTVVSTPTLTSSPTPRPSPTVTPSASATAGAATPVPTSNNSNSNNISDWVYPGSLTDSTDTITDWYKKKIESMGFNVKSFVKTSANDVIKNVLSAAKAGEEIYIEITKNPGDTEAKIIVR